MRRTPSYAAAAHALVVCVLAACAVTVGCLAGCESDAGDPAAPATSAPVIDEARIQPANTLVRMDLRLDPDQAFSVEGAAVDPDGDAIHRYWYLLTSEDQTGVAPVSALPAFFYRPCAEGGIPPLPPGDSVPIYLFLQVDISDRPRLTAEDGAALAEPRTYPDDAHVQTRDWVLSLRGVCPAE